MELILPNAASNNFDGALDLFLNRNPNHPDTLEKVNGVFTNLMAMLEAGLTISSTGVIPDRLNVPDEMVTARNQRGLIVTTGAVLQTEAADVYLTRPEYYRQMYVVPGAPPAVHFLKPHVNETNIGKIASFAPIADSLGELEDEGSAGLFDAITQFVHKGLISKGIQIAARSKTNVRPGVLAAYFLADVADMWGLNAAENAGLPKAKA